MNKIQVEDITNEERNITIDKDSTIIIKNSKVKLNFDIKTNINIFLLFLDSDIELTINTQDDFILNIFSVDTSLKEIINLNQDNIKFNYTYSTINKNNNKYKIDVNHLGNNIESYIVSHGINLENDFSFTINAKVPNEIIGVKTTQDSKIILEGGTALIKPNLLVDIDEVEANHSAYIGSFKEDEMFYLKTRGICEKDAIKLLAKSFLIGNMSITFRERNIILDILKRYWR